MISRSTKHRVFVSDCEGPISKNDNAFELAIGICALLGGVYGTRAVRFLKQARKKSQALQEIIAGNELFKKEHKAYAGEFKQAHKEQSPQTRQIVAEMKA